MSRKARLHALAVKMRADWCAKQVPKAWPIPKRSHLDDVREVKRWLIEKLEKEIGAA